MDRFTLKAPAKLNLMLGVSPTIIGGKHLLTSVFSTIELSDELSFSFEDTKPRQIAIEVTSSSGIPPLDLPIEQNMVYKAVCALEKVCSRALDGHLSILVEKSIPHEAGLAGGSTDAAVTLLALSKLWGIDPLGAPVLEAAAQLGADVLFFLHGGCALMGGDGGTLLRQLTQPSMDLVLVKPNAGISTAAAYKAFDADPQPIPSYQRLLDLLETEDTSVELIAGELANNLTKAACLLLPGLAPLIDEVAAQKGVYTALLAGSGSTVFGVCENAGVAAELAARFSQKGYWAAATSTAQRSHR